jgi:hypothetical protein
VHVVTKILVVFCAVLSLLLAALTMAYAANAGEIRKAYKTEVDLRLAAEAAKKDAESQRALLVSEYELKLRERDSAVEQREALVKNLQGERAELKTQVEQLKAAAESNNNRLIEISSTASTQAELIKVYRDEVTRLRDESLTASRREIDLVDRINDLESAREVLEQTARALREQLHEAQVAAQTAATGGRPASAGAGTPFVNPGPLITARVTEVFKTPAGEDMVVINEGSNRDIQKNMDMSIVRGADQFIAKLIIVSVEPQRAVGRVEWLNRKPGEIKPQDRVLSRLNN